MSSRFYEKVLRSGPSSTATPFHCSFGAAILKKFGWSEGNGLGKEESGRTSCVVVEKRPDGLGLGANSRNDSKTNWTNWWDDLYNDVASKIQIEGDGDSTSSSESDVSEMKHSAKKQKENEEKNKLMRVYRRAEKNSIASRDPLNEMNESCVIHDEEKQMLATACIAVESSKLKKRKKKRRMCEEELIVEELQKSEVNEEEKQQQQETVESKKLKKRKKLKTI